MPRQTYSFVPIKPDKLLGMSGVERVMTEKLRQPEKHYDLDTCPICGGKALIEYVGTWCNAVCQKCGCSSGSYKNPVWAAKRWNSRVGVIKADDCTSTSTSTPTSTFDVLFINDNDNGQMVQEPSKPTVFKPYCGKKKGIVDLPEQMLFDFCSPSGEGSSNG